MPLSRQPDLFRADEPELLEHRPEHVYRADPDEVRRELHALLAKARAAQSMPWPDREAGMWQVVFPQMSNWLPEDEAKQLCLEFEVELRRLEAA